MAATDVLYEEILNKKPTLEELCELVPISTKWYQMGILLKLNVKKLNEIEEESKKTTDKVLKMYELWLDTNPQATRQQIVETLKMDAIEENTLAQNYETKLRELHSKTEPEQPPNEASDILQHYYTALSQSLIYPVQISQLLYSERCIREITLDEVETLESSLDDKKMSLLNAISTAVSSDHQKLKILAITLSKFEEMRLLGDNIYSEYTLKYPDDKETGLQRTLTRSVNDQMSHEDQTSDILRYHYGSLSQSLYYTSYVAQMLCGEKVISEETLKAVEVIERSESERRTVLLKAVRHAVHNNYHNLEVFANVLRITTIENAQVAGLIFNDYKQIFHPPDNIIPEAFSQEFNSIRAEFANFFTKVQDVFKAAQLPADKLKRFLQNYNPHLKSQLIHASSIDDVLDIVREKCSLIDITCLEVIVDCFNLLEAKKYIEDYKSELNEFCNNISARLAIKETFEVVSTPSPLKCETIEFVLAWEFKDDYALKDALRDVKDILTVSFERLAKIVQVIVIAEEHSITVTCTFPFLLTTLLIAKAQENLESLKKRGLIKLIIGHCVVFDKDKRDEEFRLMIEEKEREMKTQKEMQSKVIRKMSAELDDLKSKDRQQEADTKELLSVSKSELEEEQKEIKELKLSLKESKATDKVLVEKQEEIEKLTKEKEATDKLLVEKQKEIEIFQEKISTLTLQLREKEVGKVKDDSKSGYNKVSNARNLPPGSYDLLIIGSYGEVSKSQAIIVVQKLIPPHLKGSDQWMTDEIAYIEKKHVKATNCHRIVSYLDHLGAQDSKSCYLERITIFLQECKKRNQDKVIIFYTGNGEKNTGNWCFKDGVITFQEIYGIYMAQFQGKRLTINSDCSYSGNWIKDCAKQLDNLKIPSCGHYTRSLNILLNVWSSCDIDQEATALCYVTEAIKYDERKEVVVTDFHTVLSSGQKTRLGDFRQLNCGNADDQKCGLDDISTITWEDRMFHKPELVKLVKKWYYVLIDEDKLEAFKAEAGGTQMFKVTNYGKILYEGFGEKPPPEVNRQLDFKFMPTVDPEY